MRLKNVIRKEMKANKETKIINLYKDRVRDYNLIASIDINYINTLNVVLLNANAYCNVYDAGSNSLEIVVDLDCLN